jgi:hypothetical protein
LAQVVEQIPHEQEAEVAAALAFINAERGSEFHVTGIVDPEEALARRRDEDAFDLALVLCQGDLCLKERVRIRRGADGIECTAAGASADSDDPPPLLDPPVGTRKGWLDEQLSKHAFVVLIFYRGFW